MSAFMRLVALVFALGITAAQSETYPARPIRLIVPFAAGGTVDIIARILATRLSAITGSNFIVDNRGGAGGVVGTQMAVQAPGDGYTLLIHSGSIAYDPSLHDKLPYDTARDLAPVAMIGMTPNLLVVTPSFPARSAGDLIRMVQREIRDQGFALREREQVGDRGFHLHAIRATGYLMTSFMVMNGWSWLRSIWRRPRRV
jgi:tripartite-type tricarboxylate transporter receptor subunit TctC